MVKKIYPRKLALILAGVLSSSVIHAIELQHPHVDYFESYPKPTNRNLPQVTQPIFSKRPVGQLRSTDYADVLGWVPSEGNICGGYYQEQAIVMDYPSSTRPNVQTTIITAAQPSLLSQTGTSVLEGNVTLTQPGRQIIADRAYLYRDPQTGKIATVDMIGNVRMREAGRLVVSQKVHVDMKDNTATIQNAVYRFAGNVQGSQEALNAWGTLAFGQRLKSGVLDLHGATYSTCPPTSETWRVRAEHLLLNKETGVGKAFSSTLDFFGLPVFYSPFFEFPIDDRRKTGFLFPTFGYTNDGGLFFALPYYLNLAPNYDATLTPALYTKRGYQQRVNFRYLTHTSNGEFNFSFLPYDRYFAEFKNDAQADYAGTPFEDRYISELKHSSNARGFFSYIDNSVFNEHWSGLVNVNYASDDYYLQDFGATPGQITSDQLLNQAQIKYQDEYWRFLALLQGYETLHPINQAVVQDQYARVPELDFNVDYPNLLHGLDFGLDSQFVNFDHPVDFLTREPVVTGQRYRLVPKISLPLANMSGYFTPEIQLDNTFYNLQNPNPNPNQFSISDLENPSLERPSSITRTLPILDIDSGLYFDRNFMLYDKAYRQTLEPRIFYLYIPTTNQNDIPIFDTTLPPFSYEQMFQTNRFTGWDRLGDANQVTLALTTRFLDDYSGQEKLRASVGAMYLFAQHQVFCAGLSCMPDPTVNQDLSPVVGELSYNLNPNWNITSDLAWDPNRTRTNDAIVNLTYNAGKEILNFGYYFVRDADLDNNVAVLPPSVIPPPLTPVPPLPPIVPTIKKEDLNRIDLGVAWPLTNHWSFLGNINYNITENTPQVYFAGAQYDSCCWAVRFIVSHTLTSIDQFNNTHFDNQYYLQFQLKGLANFGYNDASSLLASALPGYQDQFQGFFKPLR